MDLFPEGSQIMMIKIDSLKLIIKAIKKIMKKKYYNHLIMTMASVIVKLMTIMIKIMVTAKPMTMWSLNY